MKKNIKINKWGRGNMLHVYGSRICILNLKLLAFIVSEISTFVRTDKTDG